MKQSINFEDVGKLILRVTCGGLLLFHGIHKLEHGHTFIRLLLQEHGWPGFLVYGVPLAEVVAPILLLAGVQVKPAAALIACLMLVTLYLFYGPKVFTLDQYGAFKSQVNLLFLGSSLSLIFAGAGKYTVVNLFRKE